MIRADRLSIWCRATDRFSEDEAREHSAYVRDRIVPYARKYEWAAVLEYDRNFRVLVHAARSSGSQTFSWRSLAFDLLERHLSGRTSAAKVALASRSHSLCRHRHSCYTLGW